MRGKDERGIIIALVAVVMLGVVGAMAALSIDVVTIYTARSEAQLAADSAALAAARVLANSGATSDTTGGSMTGAWTLASAVALQVAEQNRIGGVNLIASQITIPAAPVETRRNSNWTFTIRVQVNNLPTFFARIWGTKFITVGASATAEVYNPWGAIGAAFSPAPPVAPICVKPWLLPNMDPKVTGAIFDPNSGTIQDTTLLGWTSVVPGTGIPMSSACGPTGDCSAPPNPTPWNYYPGDDLTFPHPTNSLPSCTPALTSNYQQSIAGCVPTPIACNAQVNIDNTPDSNRDLETTNAVTCLTHTTDGSGDKVDVTGGSIPPFQFIAGADNPIVGLSGKDVEVSDSLVTVPVFNSSSGVPPTNPVTIVGFVQLFLNPDGLATPTVGQVNATVINMVGCGTKVGGTPILGNGASPVTVRLISPPPAVN